MWRRRGWSLARSACSLARRRRRGRNRPLSGAQRRGSPARRRRRPARAGPRAQGAGVAREAPRAPEEANHAGRSPGRFPAARAPPPTASVPREGCGPGSCGRNGGAGAGLGGAGGCGGTLAAPGPGSGKGPIGPRVLGDLPSHRRPVDAKSPVCALGWRFQSAGCISGGAACGKVGAGK